jgi:hypothetical protein
MNLKTAISATATLTETIANGLGSGSIPAPWIASGTTSLASGTGSGQADLSYTKSITLAAAASTTLTLSALTDDLGRAVNFARVKLLILDNGAAATGNNVTIASGATHGWTAPAGAAWTLTVHGGGVLLLWAPLTTGYVVTGGTSDQVTITNTSGVSLTLKLVLAGASA